MNISSNNDFDLRTISQHGVLDELYSLDCSKAIGHSNILVRYIKKIAE